MIRSAGGPDLDAKTLYALLRLRAEVFVVEQACPYLDPDGRDRLPGVRHWWVEDDGEVVSCLRVLPEPDGAWRIGRVATAQRWRRRGSAAALISAVTADLPRPVVLDAQSHLTGWYERLGFVRDGSEFIEDGIPHQPMRLA